MKSKFNFKRGIISIYRPHVPPRGATVYIRRSARLENSNAMPRSGGAVEVRIHMSYLRGSYFRTRMSARRSMRVYEGGTHVKSRNQCHIKYINNPHMFGMGGSFDKPSSHLSKRIYGNRGKICTEKYT